MKQSPVITVDTIQGFQCIMGACEDNCCRNTTWNIIVDPASYKKYQEMDNDLGRHILSCIETAGDNIHRFKQFEHGHCPLLTDDGLCYIHKNLGAEYLCTTCTTYPRLWDYFNGKLEHGLSLSCPEVVRWVLYRKKRINFVGVTANAEPPSPNPGDEDTNKVRTFLFEIMDYRKFSVKDKLLFMGLFMRSLSKSGDIDKVVSTYRSSIRTKGLLDSIKSDLSKMEAETRQEFFQNVAVMATAVIAPPKKIPEGVDNAKYYELIGEFHKDVENETSKNYLSDTFDRLMVPYVNANANVFNNYLMYVVFTSNFLKAEGDYAKAYAGFAGEFVTMLTFATGLFNKYETIGHEEMVAAIYLYHRKVSHSNKIREILSDTFTDNILSLVLGVLGGIN